MANITTKELSALSDQLNFEQVLSAKYQTAASAVTDPQLKASCETYAKQHKENFQCLLAYLK